MLIVLAACFAFGWFVLVPHEFMQLGKHIASSFAFITNYVLWGESGYFDNTSETKPLLHLWSLAIEEQFYLIWPIILWASWRKKLNIFAMTLVLTLISFLINLVEVKNHPVAVFYSPQTRFWELLIGAILATARIKQYRFFLPKVPNQFKSNSLDLVAVSNVVSIAGTICLIISVAIINKSSQFPGVIALVPVTGAALLIAAGKDAWINRKILSNRVMVWVGLISFPLYLWHWPLLSFARIIERNTLKPFHALVILVISVLLAWITYALVERKIRLIKKQLLISSILFLMLLAMGFVGYNSFVRDGLPFRGPNVISKSTGEGGGAGVTPLNQCGLPADEKVLVTCLEDPRAPAKYALVGDSKAMALFGGLVRTSNENGRWLLISNGAKVLVVPVISSNPLYEKFQLGAHLAVKAFAENKDIETVVIVVATRNLFLLKNDTDIEDLEESTLYDVALDGLQNTITQLKAANKKIVFVVDNPTLPHPEDCIVRMTGFKFINLFINTTLGNACKLPLEKHLILSNKYRKLLLDLENSNKGIVSIFDMTKFMCDDVTKLCETYKNGRMMYSGTDHISDYAAGLIGKELNDYLRHITHSISQTK